MNIREHEAAYVIASLLDLVADLAPDSEYADLYGIPSKLDQAHRCLAMLNNQPTFSGDQS